MRKKKETRGRKPVDDDERKIQVSFYTKNKHIKANGGMESVKTKCKKVIEA